MQEAYHLLTKNKSDISKGNGGKTIKMTSTQPTSSAIGCGLLPPSLIHRSDTKMEFMPRALSGSGKEDVAYYRLYGRLATGSNLKVRLSDSSYPGLGLEVSR